MGCQSIARLSPALNSSVPTVYSQLSPCEHPAITYTPVLGTEAKSPAETTKKCMETTPAIAEFRYYGIGDTSCRLKVIFLLFFSRYNEQLGRIEC